MIAVLEVEFSKLVIQLIENCNNKGIYMVPYEKLRSPYTQAEYWVQGRSEKFIDKTLAQLQKKNACFLAECIRTAKRKEGKIITNALPGCSWHQWGEAIDCYWLKDDKVIWDLSLKDVNNQNGYQVYAYEARALGLEAGFFWKEIVDATHVQFRKASSPLNFYSIVEINEIMKDVYD